MEQKVEFKNKEELLTWIEKNHRIYPIENEADYFTLQAFRDTSITVCFEEDDDIDEIISKTINRLESFDADDEFMELWSVDFANHNHFKPSQFLKMLQEDEASFKELARKLEDVWH